MEWFVEGASCMGLRAVAVGTLKLEGSVKDHFCDNALA